MCDNLACSIIEIITQHQTHFIIWAICIKLFFAEKKKKTLTETVKNYHEYLPHYLPMPHPSPRNRFWLQKNEWFEQEIVPVLKDKTHQILSE